MPEKEEFFRNLNMGDNTDLDYMHAKKISKEFEIKILGEYHDLYLKTDTLPLANFSESFWEMCLQICHLDPAKFLSAPGLAWQAALKKTKVKQELLVEKGIRKKICHLIHQYAKANDKYMGDFDRSKESSYLEY